MAYLLFIALLVIWLHLSAAQDICSLRTEDKKGCCYDLGVTCDTVDDCAEPLLEYLKSTSYTASSIGDRTPVACSDSMCKFITLDLACEALDPNLKLPDCQQNVCFTNSSSYVSPTPAPELSPICSSPLGEKIDMALNSMGGCCYEFEQNTCETIEDCQIISASFVVRSTTGEVPTDGLPYCYNNVCYLINPNTSCSIIGGDLPNCSGDTCISAYANIEPSAQPAPGPIIEQTQEPILEPTLEPTFEPTFEPTLEPTFEPTKEPAPVSAISTNISVLDPICYTNNPQSKGCCIEFGGPCNTRKNCTPSFATYLASTINRVPDDSISVCYQSECFFDTLSVACNEIAPGLDLCPDSNKCIRAASFIAPGTPPFQGTFAPSTIPIVVVPSRRVFSPPSAAPAPSPPNAGNKITPKITLAIIVALLIIYF